MNSVLSNTKTAEPVLLLHCSASSGRQWEGLADQLAGRYQVRVPDLYGYGDAVSWTGPGPLHLAAEAARAVSTLPAGRHPVHVVGHSYGGAVALRLAADHAARVRSLTLIEPVAFHVLKAGGARDRRFLGSVQQVAERVIEGVLSGDYHGAMEHFVDYWNGEGAWRGVGEDARRRFARHAPKVVLDFHAAINEDTPLARYRSRFVFPVRIIRGGRSPEPARRVAGLLNEHIPGSELVTVAEAGHMLPLTHPGQVNPLVLELIERNPVGQKRAA